MATTRGIWVGAPVGIDALRSLVGASIVGYDDTNLQAIADDARALAGYTALRAFRGRATGIKITDIETGGLFQRDDVDTVGLDNGSTIIVDALQRRWKRLTFAPPKPAASFIELTGLPSDNPALVEALAEMVADPVTSAEQITAPSRAGVRGVVVPLMRYLRPFTSTIDFSAVRLDDGGVPIGDDLNFVQDWPLSKDFETLEAAQLVFPFVTDLADQRDWAELQAAAIAGSDARNIFSAEGRWLNVNRTVYCSAEFTRALNKRCRIYTGQMAKQAIKNTDAPALDLTYPDIAADNLGPASGAVFAIIDYADSPVFEGIEFDGARFPIVFLAGARNPVFRNIKAHRSNCIAFVYSGNLDGAALFDGCGGDDLGVLLISSATAYPADHPEFGTTAFATAGVTDINCEFVPVEQTAFNTWFIGSILRPASSSPANNPTPNRVFVPMRNAQPVAVKKTSLADGAINADIVYVASGEGAAPWTVQKELQQTFRPEQYQNVNQAYAQARAVRGTLCFQRGKTYQLLEPLDIHVGGVTIEGNGAVLDCSACVSPDHGYAVRFIPNGVTAVSDDYVYQHKCERLLIRGPNTFLNPLNGVFTGRPPEMSGGNTAGGSLWLVQVEGFIDNWTFGDQTWLISFFHCNFRSAKGRGNYFDSQTNAGENYNFHSGCFDGCVNSGGSAVALSTSVEGNSDINFFGTSFDYSDIEIHTRSGQIALQSCHIENRSANNPMIKVESTGGFEPAKIDLQACTIAPTEASPGRASIITVSGDRSVVRVTGGTWAGYDKPNTEFVTVLSGSPLVIISGLDPIVRENYLPIISRYTSILDNGDFEAGVGKWMLPTSINFARNGRLDGAVTGTPGTLPTNWAVSGSLNGLQREIVSVSGGDSGRPALVMRLFGTPTATQAYGVSLEPNLVAGAAGQEWTANMNIRTVGAPPVGATLQVGIQERDGAGVLVSASSATRVIDSVRRKYSLTRLLTGATTTTVRSAYLIDFVSGVPVDATYALDTPELVLSGDPQDGGISALPTAAFPTARHGIDSTTFYRGTKSLVITNNGTGNYGLSRDFACRPGGRIMVRGMVKTNASSGSAGLKVQWLNAENAEVFPEKIIGTQLLSGVNDWAQRGGTPAVPTGAVKYRLWVWTVALNGSAWFDDILVWNI